MRFGKVVVEGDRVGNLYKVTLYHPISENASKGEDEDMIKKEIEPTVKKVNAASLKVWHERYNHLNVADLKKLVKDGMIAGIEFDDTTMFDCEACIMGKHKRHPFKNSKSKTTRVGEVFHLDTCGPFTVQTPEGFRWFTTATDDYSRHTFVTRHMNGFKRLRSSYSTIPAAIWPSYDVMGNSIIIL